MTLNLSIQTTFPNRKKVNHKLTGQYGECFQIPGGLESSLYLFPASNLILKKANKGYQGKIIKEANWIQDLPKTLKSKFPAIYSINKSDHSYLMEALMAPPISKLLQISTIDTEVAFSYWVNSYNFFWSQREHYKRKAPSHWESRFINKAKNRLLQLQDHNNIYQELINFEYIKIDNVKYLNAPTAIDKIEKLIHLDTLNSLKPPFITLMHLDLQFTNILSVNDGMLIDPAGEELGDPLYDLMKAAHYIDHEYINHLFIEAREEKRFDNSPSFTIQLVEDRYNKQRNCTFLDLLNKIDTWVVDGENDGETDLFPNQWKLRFWYLYSTTMLGGVLHLLRSNQAQHIEKSITRYIFSVRYLNIFLNMYTAYLRKKGFLIPSYLDGITEEDHHQYSQNYSSQLSSIIISAQKIYDFKSKE